MLQLNVTFRPNKPARFQFPLRLCFPFFLPTDKKRAIFRELLQPNRAAFHRADRRVHFIQIRAESNQEHCGGETGFRQCGGQ